MILNKIALKIISFAIGITFILLIATSKDFRMALKEYKFNNEKII